MTIGIKPMGYSFKETKELWKEIDKMAVTVEVATVRGWIMDAIEKLVTPESFEEWLDTDNLEVLKERNTK